MSVTEQLSAWMAKKISRRNFLVRGAFAGSAIAAGRGGYLLTDQSAYRALCDSPYCGSSYCSCSDTCCVGFTEFCCVLDGGYNSCPEGTIMGGWWMAAGSLYCEGPRYYMDCNAVCACEGQCGDYYDNGFTFCGDACDGLTCECALGNCGNYLTGCFQFRYGQCNQDVRCTGRIHCRVVTCVPPWEIDPTCTTTPATDDGTADEDAPCLSPGPTYPPPPPPPPPPPFHFKLEEIMFIAKAADAAAQYFISGNTKVHIVTASDLAVYEKILQVAGLDSTTQILSPAMLAAIPTAVPSTTTKA